MSLLKLRRDTSVKYTKFGVSLTATNFGVTFHLCIDPWNTFINDSLNGCTCNMYMLASSCFSRKSRVRSHQKGWQLSCHLFWCKLTLIFTVFPSAYPFSSLSMDNFAHCRALVLCLNLHLHPYAITSAILHVDTQSLVPLCCVLEQDTYILA